MLQVTTLLEGKGRHQGCAVMDTWSQTHRNQKLPILGVGGGQGRCSMQGAVENRAGILHNMWLVFSWGKYDNTLLLFVECVLLAEHGSGYS